MSTGTYLAFSLFNLVVAAVTWVLVWQTRQRQAEIRQTLGRIEAPPEPTQYLLALYPGADLTYFSAQKLQDLTRTMLHDRAYSIVVSPREDAPSEDMAWRAEVWNAHRGTILAAMLPTDREQAGEVVGLGVPYYLNDGPTYGSVLVKAAEWVMAHS